MIDVVRPGLFTTVQDEGRWGHQRFGVPVAGPMDPVSHRLANLIVGNRPSCATLEVTLLGPHLTFSIETLFVVTGARFRVTLDDGMVEMDTATVAHPGQQLMFGDRESGARAYVGVSGGIDVPVVLGSRSTHTMSRLGGVEGRALKAGDRLAVGRDRAHVVQPGHHRAASLRPEQGGARVRVLLGPHEDRFGRDGVATLQQNRYVVTSRSDRMGYRLAGPTLEQSGPELLSSPVETGAIQVPPSGEPIVLMADHQTTGGYPRIGTVITADIPAMAQLSPSEWVEFAVCDHEQAMQALIEQERLLIA